MSNIDRFKVEKEKLKLKEQQLKAREQRHLVKWYTTIGRLAARAGIDGLTEELLLGAFSEISEKLGTEQSRDVWRKKAAALTKKLDDQKGRVSLCVSFKTPPPLEIKQKMRDFGLKWNSFRKEFFGYGQKDELTQALKGCDAKIDIIH